MRKAPLVGAIVLLVGLVSVYNQAIGEKSELAVKAITPVVQATDTAPVKADSPQCSKAQSACCAKTKAAQAQAIAANGGCDKSKSRCNKAKATAAQLAKDGSGCCARKQAQTQPTCGDKGNRCPRQAQDSSENVSL